MSPALRTLVALSLLVPSLALAGKKEEKKLEKEIAADVKAISALTIELAESLRNDLLQSSHLEIGGGQNPWDYEIVYQGGTDQDFQRDPFIAPFKVRRITCALVRAGVGPSTSTFVWDPTGALVFAYTTGTDISGVNAIELQPPSELRAYYKNGEPFQVSLSGTVWNLPTTERPDLPTSPETEAAKLAAEQLRNRSLFLSETFAALAK